MLNSVGLANPGLERVRADHLPWLAARLKRARIIVNVVGFAESEYAEVIAGLEACEGIAGYELNLSCPNTKHGGIAFGSDPALIQEVTAAVKKVSRRPVWVKLSPNVTDIRPFAQAAEAGGADAISLVNTFVGMQLEDSSGRRTLPGGTGGLSGPAIHSLAVRLVYQAARAVRIPVIGIGGILCGADAAELLRAGATAVEVGTANFYDPRATLRIARELEDYCRQTGLRHVSELSRSAAGPPPGRNP